MKFRYFVTAFFTFFICSLHAQIVVQGVSPGTIAGPYNFTWADPAGGDWSTPDFNIPGNFVLDTLSLVEDGTPGVSPDGHNLSNEGCNSIINNPAGKIAIIYRGNCEFGLKALNAQQAGAVGVILINNDNTVMQMGGGANGLSVTIPVVMINSTDGATLVNEMQNGAVVMLLGNQNGASSNDIGCVENEVLSSPYGGAYEGQFDGFDLGLIAYNYGTNNQSSVTVHAQIVGPTGIVYDQTVGPLTINASANESLLPGTPNAFPPFDMGGVGNYPLGDYTLTYTLDMGTTDEFPGDNIVSFDFSVNNKTLAHSRVDANGHPIATDYPANSTVEYQSCSMIQESNFNGAQTGGVFYIPHADTSQFNPVGGEIFANLYQWDDAWTDLNDPNYQFDPGLSDAFQNLNLITFGVHTIANVSEIDNVGYIPFGQTATLQNGTRYLVCMQTFDTEISFGYDDSLNYSGNVAHTAQPVAPVHVDGSWYISGWLNYNAPSIALDLDTTCFGSYATLLYAENTCAGQNGGSLAIDVNGFGGAPTINWNNGATNDTLNNLSAGTYTATITDTAGCSATISAEIEEILLHVVSDVTHETCDLSNDGSINVLTVTNGVPPLSYQWNTGDTTAQLNGLDNGSYELIVTDANGCTVTSTYNVGSGNPNFGLSAQASPDWGAPPLPVTFSNQTPNLGNYNFTWYFGDGNSVQSNAPTVQHTYTTDGIWDVTLVAEDTATGCIDSTTFVSLAATNSNVGLNALELKHNVLLVPNPNNGDFTVISHGFSGKRTLDVLTVEGQIVHTLSSSDSEVHVHLPKLEAGVYFLRISDEESLGVERFVLY